MEPELEQERVPELGLVEKLAAKDVELAALRERLRQMMVGATVLA